METHGRKKSVAEAAPLARDPCDVKTIKRLQQRIQELEFQQLQEDSPTEETETKSNVWDDGSEDVNHFSEENPLLTKETELEPIWDIGDEEEYKQNGQEDHVKTLSQHLNNVSIDSDNVASSHNRVYERHDSLNRGKRQKFKVRGRVPGAAKNEMSMASIFVDEGALHSKQHIEDFGAHDTWKNQSAREAGPMNNLRYKGIMQPSQYRVFIIDYCGTLPPEWWCAISKVIDRAPRRMIEESSGRSFKDDSVLDVANLARDIYPGNSNNISKQKGQEDHVKTLSQQLNNVPIDSDSVASSHNRVHGRHDCLNRGKWRKFKGRGRVPRETKNKCQWL
nr:protein STICHEL-like 3 isoform X1 [Tanacetum cinerariifolium]